MQVTCLNGCSLLSVSLSSEDLRAQRTEQSVLAIGPGLFNGISINIFVFFLKYVWDVSMDGFGILLVWFGFLTNQCHYAYVSVT